MAYDNVDIKSFIGTFLNEYNRADFTPWYERVANIYTGITSGSADHYGINPPKDMASYSGTRQLQAPADFKVTIANAVYENSLKFGRYDYLKNPKAFEAVVKEMARKARGHFRKLVLSLITTNGTGTSDAQNFFDTDHPYNDGAAKTQKNAFVAADIAALDVVAPATPTDVEMGNIILGGLSQMLTLVDAAGDVCNDDMREVIILTGDVAKHAAVVKSIANSVLAGGIQSPVAPLVQDGYKFSAILEPSLTGASIYMLRGDSIVKPFICQESGLDFQTLGIGSEYEQETLNVLFGVSSFRNAGYGRYQSAIKLTLS